MVIAEEVHRSGEYAVESGKSRVMKHVLDNDLWCAEELFPVHLAVKMGRFDVVRWCWKRKLAFGPGCMVEAVKTGNMKMVELLSVDGVMSQYAEDLMLLFGKDYKPTIQSKARVCLGWKGRVGYHLLIEAVKKGHVYLARWVLCQVCDGKIPCKIDMGECYDDYTIGYLYGAGYTLQGSIDTPVQYRSIDNLNYLVDAVGIDLCEYAEYIDMFRYVCRNQDPGILAWVMNQGLSREPHRYFRYGVVTRPVA